MTNLNLFNRVLVKRVGGKGVTPFLPTYATDGSAGFDFYAGHDAILNYGNPVVIDTGLQFEIPKGFGMFLYSRSGMGFNGDIRLGNCVGVIDCDYRGNLFIKLTTDVASWDKTRYIKTGDKIAQGVISHTPRVSFIEVDTLSDTERGSGGFGSTGV